ncbi:MAG: hypothetical protein IKJ50_04825 [Clostridia bacterium]|nr:hypothetical protein [Clostridia bacterium]
MLIPEVQIAQNSYDTETKKMFIVSEGFEKRSLYWISKKENKTIFEKAIICRYLPSKKSRFNEMYKLVKAHAINEPTILDYNRFEPTAFEQHIKDNLSDLDDIDEIVIDISVMSKLLIMIILCCLGNFNKKITIIYSEPSSWGPTENKYKNIIANKTYGTCIGLSSVGVGDVVRTPMLSSIVMQDCPIYLVTFLSFNEQLINVLMNEISPTKIHIINHKCSQEKWREDAMLSIHQELIKETVGKDDFDVVSSYNLRDYKGVFEKISKIYKDNCYNYRIVVSPTGCKLHAVACALLKLCCSDVHVEYPTPESYLFDDYSSEEVSNVYSIIFDNYKKTIQNIATEYSLNG